jgi:hypothetical protein
MQCVDYHEDIQKAIVGMNSAISSSANLNLDQPGDPPGQDDDW